MRLSKKEADQRAAMDRLSSAGASPAGGQDGPKMTILTGEVLGVQQAPVFYPSLDEFKDSMAYIQK